jgi:hypothetical protein
MRALVALVIVALVGLAVDAQIAAAGSSPLKKPKLDLSASVDLGSASVVPDVSSTGAEASAEISTASTSVDTTVEVSPTAAPVSATVDASTPVARTAAEATVPISERARVKAKVSTPLGSATLRADTPKPVEEPVRVTRPVVGGGTPVTAESGHRRVTPTISTPVRRVRTAPERASTGQTPKPAVAGRQATNRAPQRSLLTPSATSTLSPVAAGREPAPAADVASPAPSVRLSRPDSAPAAGESGGAFGSGISTGGFFALLSALLMLAAPTVGRWLRPSIGMALRPAFTSLPERPG